MQLLVCVLSSVHLAASVFFHEHSPIDLAPPAKNSAFGFSLAYQKGKNANLLVGAPLFDLTGRVYQCPLDDIRQEKNTCNLLDIDLDKMGVHYNRSLSTQQHFYLGASIAATEKFFVTCAPLRTASHFMRTKDEEKIYFGAFGICFYYDQAGLAHTCHGHGLERDVARNISLKSEIYGGAGWTTLVDEPHDRILIAKSFDSGDIIGGSSSQPDSDYRSFVRRRLIHIEKGMTNFGQAMTFGNYFDIDEKATFYAVSFKQVTTEGGVHFINGSSLKLAWTLYDTTVGSMFGEALCSADVTGDGRADLFVGAPAYATDARSYDRGAVNVYTKSDKRLEMDMKLMIVGEKDGARFGSTLATNDVDRDSYPEIFVSAISENSGAGALYVLCGFEIHQSIHNSLREPTITVSELKRTQRIEKKSFSAFGFRIQPVPDFNENGSDELGVSAPDNSTVSLYRGIRSMTAKVTSRFSEATDKSESANEYTFHSCVAVDFPPKPKKITTKLLVKNILNGKGASIKNVRAATYQIDFATEKGVQNIYNNTEYCRNLSMIIPSSCKVTTEVSLVDNIQNHTKFENTWVSLSAQSKLKNEVQLTCRCNTTCAPNLRVQLDWSGRNKTNYVVGTSRSEKVTISVHNNGTTGCDSCARVRVIGALVEKIQCQYEDPDYECTLASPFRPNTTQKIEVLLLMDKITNQDKEFVIDVLVQKTCGRNETEPYSRGLRVPYEFNTHLLFINGSFTNRNISDTELLDETEELITDEQTYIVVNNQSMTWKNVWAKITAIKKPFIQRFTVSSTQADKCDETNGTNKFSSACLVTLAPNSTVKLVLTSTIRKKEIANYFKDWKITIDSELVLELSSNINKSKTLTTVITFEKELTVGHNKTLVIIIAVVVALLLLLIITFILYMLNFFKRKNKEELEVLKRDIRKRSVRGASSPSTSAQRVQNKTLSQETDMDDIVIVDEPFDSTPASYLQPGTSAPAAADNTGQAK